MNVPKLSPRRQKPRYIVVDLDRIPELRSGASGLYADKLIISNMRVIVVEEARTLKKRDLEQLATTI